jgi:crotonobetainyl-CoA hydratase
MKYETILFEKLGRVARITLNRPPVLNCVNSLMAQELGEAMERFSDDAELWVAVLTGAGDRAFCSGADLKELGSGLYTVPEAVQKWGFGGFVRHPCAKPIIAAVNGIALGGGFEMMLACDMVVASESASFGLPEVKRGLVASAGGMIRLPRQIPVKAAIYYAVTGDSITARQALDWGLVNQLVGAEHVQDAAMALAETVCANGPVAVRLCKELIYRSLDASIDYPPEAWDLSAEYVGRARKSEDYREGLQAFVEKRAPVWRGR